MRIAECGTRNVRANGVRSVKSQVFVPQSEIRKFLLKVRPGSTQGRDPVERRPETTCSTENLHANTPWLDPSYQGQLHNNPNCNSKLARPGARAVHPAVFL